MPEKEIELAPTEARDALDEYASRVLAALGHQQALATDESRVSDFLDVAGREHRRGPRGSGRRGPWTEVPADPGARIENEARVRACQEALRVTERNPQRIPCAQQIQLAESHPIRSLGTPEDVARAAAILASDEAAWITGIVLDVAGALQ